MKIKLRTLKIKLYISIQNPSIQENASCYFKDNKSTHYVVNKGKFVTLFYSFCGYKNQLDCFTETPGLMQHGINFVPILHFELQFHVVNKINNQNSNIMESDSTPIQNIERQPLKNQGIKMFTSSGVCSPRRRRPSNKNAIEFKSTDCRSQQAFMSFLS